MVKQIIICIFIFFHINIIYTQVIPQYSVIVNQPEATSGYYFIHGLKQNTPSQNFTNMILDRFGQIIYLKQYPRAQNDFKLQPNGKITQSSPTGSNATARFLVMDSIFNTIDTVRCTPDIFTDLHDLQLLPNGNYLALGYENLTMDLSSFHYFNGNGSPGSSSAVVLCAIVQELDENNRAVFTWKASEHFQFSDVDERWLFSPTLVDWTHCNAVEYDNDGNILLSSRYFNEITKINRQTGAIIWRLGGKRNQFIFNNDPYNGFIGQHDIRRISNGNITLFDNGYGTNSVHPARGLEYELNESTKIAELVWSFAYGNNTFSRFTGNVQRLVNRNTVIDWGKLSGGNSVFSVVKPDGSVIMELSSLDSMTSYRAFNYLTLPFTLQRPVLNCISSSGKFFLEAPEGQSSYLWSTGETSRVIQISAVDTYYVFVPYGLGGYISSERTVITNLNDPCSQVIGITQHNSEIPDKFRLFQNYPNPFNPVTKIKFEIPSGNNFEGSNIILTIYDITSKEIALLIEQPYRSGIFELSWDGSNYSSGIYFYKLEVRMPGSSISNYSEIKKMVLLK